jgi:hypothetical protein
MKGQTDWKCCLYVRQDHWASDKYIDSFLVHLFLSPIVGGSCQLRYGTRRQLVGSSILLCHHRLSGLMPKGWAPRTKGSYLIYPCKWVTEAKSKVSFYWLLYPSAMWLSSCSDFSGFISLLCHPYLPATFSSLRSSLFSFDPPPCYTITIQKYWVVVFHSRIPDTNRSAKKLTYFTH